MGELLIFHSLAALISLCSLLVAVSRNPVTAAVFLVLDLFLLGGLYALLGAHFVAAVQIIVYAGAIVVLFMFVIMLLNLDPGHLVGGNKGPIEFFFMILTTFAFVGIALAFWLSGSDGSGRVAETGTAENTVAVGIRLFSKYLWPFEISSILILLAIIASIVIAKKETLKGKRI